MSGNKINNYSSIDSNITEMQLTEDASFVGMHQVSLTNYKTTTAPTIAAGSKVEVNGALYGFSSAETITGSPSDGVVYIFVIPNGATCTAQYTNTAPTWSDAKQGWYGTGGAATYRYLNYFMVKSGTSYTKYVYEYDDKRISDVLSLVTSLSVPTAIITTANVTTLNLTNSLDPRKRHANFTVGSNLSKGALFDILDPYIPTVGNVMSISGGINTTVCAVAIRQNTDSIRILGMSGFNTNQADLDEGDASLISWTLAF